MTRILFSPIGDSDPVRACRDGAMLHILRNYEPEKVVLFFTDEMAKKDQKDDRYAKAIRKLSPACEIEKIYSGVTAAHIYDEFLTVLPKAVYGIREKYPEAEILLNLSSGTPQIKTLMAFLAIDVSNAKGIQVSTPEGSSNRNNHAEKDSEDVETMLAMNEDDEPGQQNRCEEPKLYVIRRYGLRGQIISLIQNYEYRGALQLYNNYQHLFSKDTGMLLEHAVYRESMMTNEAKKVLSEYKGRSLFKIAESTPQKLAEFFLVMKIRQRKGQLPELLVKLTPFLYELARFYVRGIKKFSLDACCTMKKGRVPYISVKALEQYDQGLLQYFNEQYNGSFRDGPLALTSLLMICEYLADTILTGNDSHKAIIAELKLLRGVEEKLRNYVAHEIYNVSEETLKKEAGMSSTELIKHLRKVMELVFENKVKGFSNVYDEINAMIVESLNSAE